MHDGSHAHTGAVSKVIASGVTIVVGLSDDRQMTFQTGFEGDETDASINARFDRMMRFADRLKAKYEVVQIRKDVIKAADTLSQLEADRIDVRARHEKAQATRRVEIDARVDSRDEMRKAARADMDADILVLNEKRQNEYNDGAAEHDRTGRQGVYKPSGNRARTLALYDASIEKARAHADLAMSEWDMTFDAGLQTAEVEIVKAEAEAAEVERSMEISVKRHTEFLENAQARVAECQAMLGEG